MPTTLERPLPTSRPRSRRPEPELRLQPARVRRLRLPELVLGVVLVGAAGLAAVWLWSSSTTRTSVAVLAAPVPAGTEVRDSDLRPAQMVLADGVDAVAWAGRDQLVGRVAVTDLAPGTLLSPTLVTDQAALAPGEALAGLQLAPGSLPAVGLAVGDQVAVVPAAGPDATPAAAVATATVWGLGQPDDTGTVPVTLRLAEAAAAQVASIADQVRIVRVVR